jgi:hypothetical protein
MATRALAAKRDGLKWGFFALMLICVAIVIYADERFLIDPADPHWKHIEPVKYLLLPHGLFGVVALIAGAFQFSDRIRRSHLDVHRWMGRLYLAAVSIAAPIAIYLGTGPLEPRTIRIEQIFQGGLWWLCAAIGFVCILNRQLALHKAWMMRSYAFTLIFILSRVPDIAVKSYSDQGLGDMLWGLIVAALFAPDLVATLRLLARARRPAQARDPKAATGQAV